jgi:Domain of unknown function (DUF4326)
MTAPRHTVSGMEAMAGPRCVRVAGDLFHGRVPPGAVYVGRAAPGLPASPYANPYTVSAYGPPEASRLYLEHVASRPGVAAGIARDLAGKDLACWCPLPAEGQPDLCHAAALLVIANQHDGLVSR